MFKEQMPLPQETPPTIFLNSVHEEHFQPYSGFVFGKIWCAETGKILQEWEGKNVSTYDSSIHSARLFKDNTEPNYGALMLAIGSGATGNILSPDAPDRKQRKLNVELARKAFSSVTFRDANGVAVAYPTNIVDFTVQFESGEANGPLTEMGLLSPISSNPSIKNHNPNSFPTYDDTLDITPYDVLLNYYTFGVKVKEAGTIMALTWRFKF